MSERSPLVCTPLEGIQPLRLGMTLDEAVALMGEPTHFFEDQHESSWADRRCYFSDDWILMQIAIFAREHPIRIGPLGVDVPTGFTEAMHQLKASLGPAFEDLTYEHSVVFPRFALAIWSEDGTRVDDFSCMTLERFEVTSPHWRTYRPIRDQ